MGGLAGVGGQGGMGGNGGAGVLLSSGANSILNQGTIRGGLGQIGGAGVHVTGGTTSINNQAAASIIGGTGTGNSVGYGVHNLATISELRNLGTITGGVRNEGTITTLTNRQSTLSYTGTAPLNYEIVIAGNGAGQYGQLSVANSANWAISDLRFGIAADSVVAVNTNYQDVIQKTGSTTFGSTASKSVAYFYNGDWYRYRLEYDTANWDLMFVSLGGFEDSTTTMGNTTARSAAAILDDNASIGALFNVGTDEEFSNAASQALPLLVGGGQDAAQPGLSGIKSVIFARQNANLEKSEGDEYLGNDTLWLKSFGSWAEQENQGSVAGFAANAKGVAIGTQQPLSTVSQMGLSFAYATTDATGNSSIAPNAATVDLYQLTGYGSVAIDQETQINYQLGLGTLRTRGQRDIVLAGLSAMSDYDSYVVTAAVDATRTYQQNETTSFTPAISAEYTWIGDDAYSETGAGNLNLVVNERRSEEFILRVDSRVDHKLASGALFSGNVGVGYDVMQRQNSITAAFAGAPSAAFTTFGLDQSPWMARGGLSLTNKTPAGVEISARYDIELNNSFLNQTASLNLSVDF
jgi:uncharacterized protein with beta-barrel porin domain